MFAHARLIAATLGSVILVTASTAAAPGPGYHAKVAVSAPTRIDWTFAVATQSLAEPPADWLPGYDARQQEYALFVPPQQDPQQPLPVIVFIPPSSDPIGWKQFEKPCQELGFLFVGVRNAGNDCPPKKRVRIVLDALDDVRRSYRTDSDRTYLAGFSGGGRIACAITFALPEYVGGVLPICAAGALREEAWLRQRVIDRLSVAFLTGTADFNRGEIERWRGPVFRDVRVRTRIAVQPGLGHGMPSAQQFRDALRWLDEDAPRRRELAQKYPATRIARDQAPGRAEQAQLLLAESKQRLQTPRTLYSGLMLLQGCMQRWPRLPAAEDAKKLLLEYDARKERPWEADDLAEQRRFLIAEARALDAYASGDLPAQYAKLRGDMLKQAIQLWEQVLADGPDTEIGREAKKRIPELKKQIIAAGN